MAYPDVQKMTIYGDAISGNCLKCKWVADALGADYDWVAINVVGGETQSDGFLALNPVGKVPFVRWPDGRTLIESNAIMHYLAESQPGGDRFIPADPYAKAQMISWMFWEQYSHETAIAVRRFQKHFRGKADSDIDPFLLGKGRRALGVMEMKLALNDYFVGDRLTLADVALVAYTRWAHEGGFDLGEFPAVERWVRRIESDLEITEPRDTVVRSAA